VAFCLSGLLSCGLLSVAFCSVAFCPVAFCRGALNLNSVSEKIRQL